MASIKNPGGDTNFDQLLPLDTMIQYIDTIFVLRNIQMKFFMAENALKPSA